MFAPTLRPHRLALLLLLGVTAASGDDETEMREAFAAAKQANARGDYRTAIAHYERALPHSIQVFGENSKNTAAILNNLGNLLVQTGQFARAEPIFLRCLKISEAVLGADHPDVASALVNLAILYRTLGRLNEAEPILNRSLKIYEAKLGKVHPDVAAVLNNLANLYVQTGRSAQAEPLYERSLKILETTLGADHADLAAPLDSLARFQQSLGKRDQAETLFKRSLKIYEAKFGPDHPEISPTLNNLAILYLEQKKYTLAEPLFQRSLRIHQAALGTDHPDAAGMLENLGILYTYTSRFAQAEPLFERGLKIREAYLGADHPEIARHELHNLAMLEVALGRPHRAAERFEQSRRIVRRYIARTLPMLSEQDQLAFLQDLYRKNLAVALSLALDQPNDPALAERTAVWLANSKAAAQDSLSERVQLGRDARDPKVTAAAAQLTAVRTELASLTLAAPAPGRAAARQARLAELAKEEQTLAKQIAAVRGQAVRDDPWVSAADIRASLPADSVLVDLVRTHVYQFPHAKRGEREEVKERWLSPHYLAWIVPPAGKGEIRLVNLGPAAEIDFAVDKYRTAMVAAQTGKPLEELGESVATKAVQEPLRALARLVLEPLTPHLGQAEELLLSPDADLWLAPWAALPTGDDQYAVERWRIRYLIAGREAALEKARTTSVKPGPARIIADPNFDLLPADSLTAYNAIRYPDGKAPAAAPVGSQPVALGSAAHIGRVSRLANTAVEAKLVAPQLKQLTQAEPRMYLDRSAQEGIVKLIRNPRVLVISTHGFFLPDQTHVIEDATNKPPAKKFADPLDNPLLRCGLLLAGCNERDKYTDPKLGDGVLTGLEIVGCDLRGTELVVLSACETGLGKVNNGEGVAGLRQAFQLAGAKSVVSTLWQIPDRQSAVLMNDFFTNLAAGQTKAEALRNAQVAMIKSRREKFDAAHPLFWAAWTITGN